ncbi:MAG: hypothetical protein IJ326_05265 [Lachnospiraceae bacterium]|nr:hypothetical protein [Lachnospiraceae bacterium]
MGILVVCGLCFAMAGMISSCNTSDVEKDSTEDDISVEVEYIFVHEGDNYRYAITDNYKEVISIWNGTEYVDVLSGAGTYRIYTDYMTVTSAKKIKEYEVFEKDGCEVVVVTYRMTNGAEASNTYTMYNKYMNIKSSISDVLKLWGETYAVIERDFLNDYENYDKGTSDYWVFPDNGDFPYKEADSIVTHYYYEDSLSMHSFVRGEEGKEFVLFENTDTENITIALGESAFSEHELEYDLVFENTSDNSEADYLALFEGRGSSLATQIQALTQAYGNTTLFYSDAVNFNIDVTNLETVSKTFIVDCTVYDYAGNVYALRNETLILDANMSRDIPLNIVSSQNGIYYIDLKVSDGICSHRELYTFSLMEQCSQNYANTNPFGVSGVRFGEYEPNDDTVLILDALGASNVRVCISHPDYLMEDMTLLAKYLEQLTSRNIRINGQYLLMKNWIYPTRENANEYTEEISSALSVVGKYLSSCESGNEFNLGHKADSIEELMQDYIDEYYNSAYRSISDEFGLDTIAGAVGMTQINWMEQMVKSGLYDRTPVFATHTYGYPYSPDISANPEYEVVVESSLVRTRQFLDTYGDKTWFLNEIGYPTTALKSEGMWSGVDLRTQADYIVRTNILGLNYGADEIETYCLYDQQNLVKGISASNTEMNFGLFYYEDYFGRIMPKPSAIAFSNMTTMLDGVQSCEELEVASDTARVFEMKMADGQDTVFVAWSNCARLSDDVVSDWKRTPCLPWANQWESTEVIELKLDCDFVELTDTMGNSKLVLNENGTLRVELSGSPCYIKLGYLSD